MLSLLAILSTGIQRRPGGKVQQVVGLGGFPRSPQARRDTPPLVPARPPQFLVGRLALLWFPRLALLWFPRLALPRLALPFPRLALQENKQKRLALPSFLWDSWFNLFSPSPFCSHSGFEYMVFGPASQQSSIFEVPAASGRPREGRRIGGPSRGLPGPRGPGQNT